MPRQSTTDATVHGFPDVENRAEFQVLEIEREIYENQDRPLSGVLKGVIERVRLLTGAEGAFIALADAWGVVCRASAGEAPVVGARLQNEPSLTRECIESGQVVISGDSQEDFGASIAATSSQLHSVVVVPVLGQGSVLGIVEILSARAGVFTTEHIAQLQRIAHLLAPILQREEDTQPAQKRGNTGVWTAVGGAALVLLLLFLWFEFYYRPKAVPPPLTNSTASKAGNSAALPAASEGTAGSTPEAQAPGTSPSALVQTTPLPQSGAGPAAVAPPSTPSEGEGIGTTGSLPPPETKARPQTSSPPPGRAPAALPATVEPSAPNKEQPGALAAVHAQAGNEPGAQTNGVSAMAAATSAPTTPAAVPSSSMANGSADRPQPTGSASGGGVHAMAASGGAGGHPEDFVELGSVPSGRYFSLGKFRDEPGAQEAADGLVKDGFHTVVVHGAGFWTTSYHVLVGPYGNEPEAEAARRKLKSDGFSPHNLPQKSRTLVLLPLKTANAEGTSKPVGSLVVAWETYSPNAIVKFVQDGKVVETAPAKWVNRGVPYQHDEIEYRETDQGSRTLLEIHFSGARETLVVAENGAPIVF
ncbi:MAG TPA: GAF domain-containing protein [Terriglobales bacterium]|nr:GAF domain-containing protein [Terriglobales bacterium]